MRTIAEVVEDIKNGTWGSDIEYRSECEKLHELCNEILEIEKEKTEKIVAELKDKKYEAGIIAGIRSTKFGEDEYEEEPYHEGKKHAYGKAIEIVKRGGVE